MYSDELSTTLRTALQPSCKFRQFCDAKDGTLEGYGKELHRGENFHWNVYSDVAQAGTTLAEGTAIPETNFVITQGTLSITEYGNSVPFTGKLDDLSEHPVKEIIHKVLKNDAKKAFDGAAAAQFDATLLRVVGTGTVAGAAHLVYTSNGTATETCDRALAKADVAAIIDTMKERNIEPYMGDDYFCLARPSTLRSFKNELESVHQYTDAGFQMILFGEIGRYEGCRFVEQTNILKGALGTKGSAWTTGDWAYFFGADTVAEAVVIPEEIRGKIPTDYGRSKGIAWYYLGGFGIVHGSDAVQARIVAWDSAA
jgi:N4-gp56 family major capsid protein